MKNIFALSTAPGRAGIAIFRLTGKNVADILSLVTKRDLPKPRFASLRDFWNGDDLIDRGLALYFPGPHSYTGEDLVELHLHGGPAVIAAMTKTLAAIKNLRMAEPGEFSRRAFDNGKLDLSALEGLADLIAAETDEQRRQSLMQAGGNLYHLCEGWREKLIRLQAQIEACIDFPDEDLPADILFHLNEGIDAITHEIKRHLNDHRRGEILRQGYRIVLLGPPNAGKSSLLNYLARREVAIVSHEPGTTRDLLEVALDLKGYAVRLTDTAGLRETRSAIEAEGIKRAKAAAESAQLRLHIAEDAKDWPAERSESDFYVLSKRDLYPNDTPPEERNIFPISVSTGQGIDALIAAIGEGVANDLHRGEETPIITRERHRYALEETLAALVQAKEARLPELLAEELRLAHRALGKIIGRTDIEAMLDLLFKEFCIGK